MNLNFALLKERLISSYPGLEGNSLQGEALYGRPVLFEPGVSLLPERIYVMEEFTLPLSSLSHRILFLFPGDPVLDDAFRSRASYLTLKSNDSMTHVLNILQQIYDEYERWEHSLASALLSGSSIQQLLTLGFSMLGCPLYVMSRGFSMVAYAGQELLPPDYQIFTNAERTIDYINSMKQNELYNQALFFEDPYIFPEQLTGIRSWNVNIQQLGHTTHRLMMLEHPRRLQEGDAHLLNVLASYIKYLLYHDTEAQVTGENNLRSIFLRLLSDSSADYVDVSKQLSALGWHPLHDYMAMVLQVTLMDQQNMTTGAICSYIEELLPHSCCLSFKKDIVVFFNLTLLEMTKEAAAEKLTCFIRDSYFKAGYSRSMHGHLNLRRQYIQARLALDVGCQKNPYIWIHHFNQIALHYLLEQTTRKLPAYMVCHEALLKLREVDQNQGTDYINTLRTYLDNHLNAVQSAKDLFIHRSTFLYRLEKIKSILDSNLEDVDELLYLLLSFRLLEMEEAKENGR